MLLDWLLKTEEGNISYEELKMSSQDRSRWSQSRWKPAIWQSTTEGESTDVKRTLVKVPFQQQYAPLKINIQVNAGK